jgi:predicted CoA-binding protein
VNGIDVYKNLNDIEFDIDIVNVFRRSAAIPEIIPDVVKKNPSVLWLQSGIRNDEAVQPAVEKGIEVIQNRCITVQYNICL